MKKALKMGLIGFVLGAAAAVGTATLGSEEAVAMPCCSSCDSGYESCISGCTDSACYDACDADWDWCFRRCSFSC